MYNDFDTENVVGIHLSATAFLPDNPVISSSSIDPLLATAYFLNRTITASPINNTPTPGPVFHEHVRRTPSLKNVQQVQTATTINKLPYISQGRLTKLKWRPGNLAK